MGREWFWGAGRGRIEKGKRSGRGFAKEEVELIQKASFALEVIFSHQISFFFPNFLINFRPKAKLLLKND